MKRFEELVGETLSKVFRVGDDELHFVLENREEYRLFHYQDCCESVWIDDVCGDLDSLIGSPILVATEASADYPDASESGTWTFYKIATVKGWVDIRWCGESNGYYSESVDFEKVAA